MVVFLHIMDALVPPKLAIAADADRIVIRKALLGFRVVW